jgi:co-chaperonin GroES (HSP10)
MPFMIMEHAEDPRKKLLDEIGDILNIEIFNNQILAAVYIRPQKTKTGIYLTDKTTDEDRYQSKVGLVIKMGPDAFQDSSGTWFNGMNIELGDWIVFRPSDGWSITVNNVLCRMIDDVNIKGKIIHPDQVW